MEDTDKPTRRRSPKARPDPAAVPLTEPLSDLLAGLPKRDEPTTPPATRAVRKRAPARQPASVAAAIAEATPVADTGTPDANVAATPIAPAALAPTPATLPSVPKPRTLAVERRARPARPAGLTKATAGPSKPPAAALETAAITMASSQLEVTAAPLPQDPPLPAPSVAYPVLPTSPSATTESVLAPLTSSPKPKPASTQKPAAKPRPRKPIAPSAEVQDALPLPQAPPWVSPSQPAAGGRIGATVARPADASSRSMRAIEALLRVLPERHRARWRDYLVLMRMDRPVGALLLLWPTWWALWFAANGMPSPALFAIFTVGVFVMRAAGCVINDYADHDWLDANVERTRGRPMAAGRVSRKEALLLFGGLLLIAFALVLFTNPLTIALSFAGAALAAIYPFAKRVTHLAQVVLGAAFGWSIPMAFAATLGEVPALGWLLFLANVLFSVIYDTQYAMVDRDEDIRVGAKSTAILFGDADRAILCVLMLSFVITLLLAGSRADLAWPWTAGVAVAAVLFGWQQSLIRDRDRAGCFAAFRNNNWVGFVIWLGLVAALLVGGG